MCHKPLVSIGVSKRKKQSGSAIIVAIFVVIIISLLGASLVSLQQNSAKGASFEVYAARAYLAAHSGSEIALTQLFPLSVGASSAVSSCVNVVEEPALPANDAGFHNCSVKISCDLLESRYKIVSTAVCETSQITTRRQITVEATDL